MERIAPEEFHWQESHYDHDSRCGRELLFLIANHEWVRATSEIIEIERSDAIDTTLKIDIDLDQITHEAFRWSRPAVDAGLLFCRDTAKSLMRSEAA